MPERRSFWEKPVLHAEEDQAIHRKVSWLELFYDLVFVAIIAQLAHILKLEVSITSVLGYTITFLPVWWVWIGSTYYADRFESFGLENRVFVFLKMVAIMFLAVFVHEALGERAEGFALSYVGARAIIIFLWLRASIHVKEFRPVGYRYVFGFSLSALLFAVSIAIPSPFRFMIWAFALLIDFATPIFTLRAQAKLPRLSSSKLPERYGLFVIIVLGETIVGVVNALCQDHELHAHFLLPAIMGIAVGFGLWWIYFDFIARRPPKYDPVSRIAWSYLHLPLVMCLAAVGPAVSHLVASVNCDVPMNIMILISAAVGFALLVMAFLEWTLQRDDQEPTHLVLSPLIKIGMGLLALCVPAILGSATPVTILAAHLMLILGPIAYGALVWFRAPQL